MIPAGQIVSRVRTLQESVATTRWSDAAIYAALNEGLDQLSIQAKFYERYATLPIKSGRRYYDLRGIPEPVLGVKSIWNTVRSDWVVPTTLPELEAGYGPRWEQATGDAQFFFMRGLNWLGLWPVPSATAGYLRIYYHGLAPHFLHSQSVIADLPNDFVPALEDYALYELAAQDGETDRALTHWQSFASRAGLFRNTVDRRMQSAGTLIIGGGGV